MPFFIIEKKLSMIRSTSTLPVPAPSSHPPTPTRLAGTGSTFDYEDWEEDRGDLIKFYNSVRLVLTLCCTKFLYLRVNLEHYARFKLESFLCRFT